jgi:hypothetical protein
LNLSSGGCDSSAITTRRGRQTALARLTDKEKAMRSFLTAMKPLLPGLLIGIGVSAATIAIAQQRSIELPTPWGSMKIGEKTNRNSAEAGSLVAQPQVYEGLKPGFAVVCKDSPLLEKMVQIGSPGVNAVVGVSVLHYLQECSQEQANNNLILLHPEDIAKLFDDVRQPKRVNASAVRAVPLSLI